MTEQMSDPLGKLSTRERQVAERYARGESYKTIAEALFVSPSTVRSHLNKIYEKLGVHNKAELTPLILAASANTAGTEQPGSDAPTPPATDAAANSATLPALRNRLIGREQ
jgi:DNA-binding CsgD family transcriptional regulator